MDAKDCLKKSEEICTEFNNEREKIHTVLDELNLSFTRLQEIHKKCLEMFLASKPK